MAERRRTDNTMAKRRRTDNTIAERRTDNTMAERRRTDNTMAERRRTKDQTMIYKALHIKLKKETPHKTWYELRCSGRLSSFRSTCGTRLTTLWYKPGDKS
jgi:hypothetical protein